MQKVIEPILLVFGDLGGMVWYNMQQCHGVSDALYVWVLCKNMSVSQLVIIQVFTSVDYRQPRGSDIYCHLLVQYHDFCMSSVINLSQMSSYPLHLLISLLFFMNCPFWHAENGNPPSPADLVPSLDVVWNGDFLGTPLGWCQTLGHTGAWDTRPLETRRSPP